MTMAKSGLLILFGAALARLASAQAFDNTGNHLLNGAYYFREVVYTSNVDVAVYGGITFDGNGNYSISGTTFDDSSFQTQAYSATGTYVVSASGYGYLQSNQILTAVGSSNAVTHGLVSNGIFVGSSTESGINDLFIAAPIASQSTGTFLGSYTLNYMDPIGEITQGTPFDAQLTLSSNGSGGIGTVNVAAYSSTSTPTTQSISGVKYFASNNAFVLQFPSNSSSNLVQGNEYLYSSPDGSFVFGGGPDNIDMIVGVQNGSSGSNFGGLYYQAAIQADLSQFATAGTYGLDTYYGSFNASNGVEVGHQRVLYYGSTPEGFTYADFTTQSSSGTYDDSFFLANYTGGKGGAIRIGYGVGPELGIYVAVQAPSFSGGGVYLNPTGVLNAASSAPFTAGVSPGELITLVGTNIGPSNLQVAQTLPFPTMLGGVQVFINNIAAPIYYVSSGQVAAIVPYEIASSSIAQIQVIYNQTPSNLVTEYINQTTPGVFTEPAGGVGDAAALHQDYSLVSSSSPAQVGETIAVYVTGLGSVLGNISDGAAAPTQPLLDTSNTITATVDGVAATVTFAGLAPDLAGLYQVNVIIPSGVTSGD
ncbi:MAG TPA: hypothetical protein VMH05_06840, partial [Bryobacteraceae bacterium]|nr:hypothetical protein [Bryobacteraceae bacterium]